MQLDLNNPSTKKFFSSCLYFIAAIATMYTIIKFGLSWSNVQIMREVYGDKTLSAELWEKWLGVLGVIASVLSLSIIYAYASKILVSFGKREVKYLFLLIALPICILCYRETIYTFQNYNPLLKPPHSSLENPKNLFKQFSIYESTIAVGLGFLFSSYHLKSIVRHVFEDILKDLVEYINHWKTGGIVCSFEQLQIEDPIIRKRYKNGFLISSKTSDIENKIIEKDCQQNREYIGKKLREIRDLSGVDFSKGNQTFLRGVDLSHTNLTDTIFKGLDLTGVNLAYSIVAGADFSGATLTGICIEGWSLGSRHKMPIFDKETVCKQVFLLQKENDGKDREPCPEKGSFEKGEFGNICTELLNKVRIILRTDHILIDILAFRLALAMNPNTSVYASGYLNKEKTIPFVDIDSPKAKDDCTAYRKSLDEIKNLIQVTLNQEIEKIRFIYEDILDGQQDILKGIESVVEKIATATDIPHEYSLDLVKRVDEFSLILQNLKDAIINAVNPNPQIQISIGGDVVSKKESAKTHIGGSVANSAISTGKDNTTTVSINSQSIPENISFEDVCTQLREKITNCLELDKEEKDAALEQLDLLSDLLKAENPEPNLSKLLKGAMRNLNGALTTVASLFDGCKELLGKLTSFLPQ
jgi:hypothetical protein